METAFDVSFVDYPRELGIAREETWGERGLANAFDSVLAAGVRRVHFRSHSAGPWWPTNVKDAAPAMVGYLVRNSSEFARWNAVEAAVGIAHAKGIKLIGWFDCTEGHAGLHTRWALRHPECTFQRRDGRREDGYSSDPVLSLAYPEVVEYRLALLEELLGFGVDGVFLTVGQGTGYEEPTSESFRAKHGIDPLDLSEDDPRWIEHQRGFTTGFVRRARRLITDTARRSGREIEFVLGGLESAKSSLPEEPGWPHMPPWAMSRFIDVEGIAGERLVDSICLWRMSEIDRLSDEVRRSVRIATRFRTVFTEEQYKTRMQEAVRRGVSLFIVNEARYLLADNRWIYPGEPGPIYVLRQKALAAR